MSKGGDDESVFDDRDVYLQKVNSDEMNEKLDKFDDDFEELESESEHDIPIKCICTSSLVCCINVKVIHDYNI